MIVASLRGLMLAGVILLMAVTGAAALPALTGPLIQGVTTDRAYYRPGQTATVHVTLLNRSGRACAGTVVGTISGRGVQIGSPISIPLSQLAAGASRTVDLTVANRPNVDHHGYLVSVVATCESGVSDSAISKIDQSSDPDYFPRPCWYAQSYFKWNDYKPSFLSPDDQFANLNAWSCNYVQMYNQLYRQHQPYTSAETWTNADGQSQSEATLLSALAAARRYGMASMAYMPLYAASRAVTPDAFHDGSGVQLSWGMFKRDCRRSCTLSDMEGFPGSDKSSAATASLAIMDPTNRAWKQYWTAAVRPMLEHFRYDGIWVDTYGAPYPDSPRFDGEGRPIEFRSALSSFCRFQKRALGVRLVVNTVSGWGEQDIAANPCVDFYLSERHPEFNDVNNFGQINYLSGLIRGYTAGRHLGLAFELYPNLTSGAARSCKSNGGSQDCYVNEPGLLYTQAQFCASGIDWAEIADQNNGFGPFITNNGYPDANSLQARPSTIQRMYDYRTYCAAMEKLFRDKVIDQYGTLTASIISGATGNMAATAGQVYMIIKTRPGLQMLHLLNYQQRTGLNPQDADGTAAFPKQTGVLQMKMYYSGSVGEANKLWIASPDVNHGVPQAVPYSKGLDGAGQFIRFAFPGLLFCYDAWLELDSLAESDYATP